MSFSFTTLRALAARHRDLVVLTLLALAVRLVWNLSVHPPLDYVYSDMGGYLERARTSIDHPGESFGYFTMFPWGTHVALALVERIFGRAARAPFGVLYALYGAIAVGYASALAARLFRRRRVTWAVGLLLCVYYPWIALGGYLLSEPPFTMFLCAAAYHAVALADRGRPRDAWLLGASLALGAIFRPQILVSLALLPVVFVARRASFVARRAALRAITTRVILPIAAPVLFTLALSAWRMEHHSGKLGLVSNNGPLNYAFGRCHATTIQARAPDRQSAYSPTSFGSLYNYGEAHKKSLFKLDPAMNRGLSVKGHIWDAEPFQELARECVAKTGLYRQVKYAITHVVLLWGYNIIWPDQGHKKWGRVMDVASALHVLLILPPAVAGLVLSFTRRRARWLLVSMHVIALLVVSMIYFGDARFRAPYDGFLVVLAAGAIATGIRALRRWRAGQRSPARPVVGPSLRIESDQVTHMVER